LRQYKINNGTIFGIERKYFDFYNPISYNKMKAVLKSVFTISILIISNMCFAQETFIRKIDSFSGISLSGNIRVELYKSDTSGIEIILKDLPVGNLITEVKSGKLNIRLKTGSNKNAIVKVKVHYSTLENLAVSSNGLITSPEVINGKSINFIARSGGKMELELKLEDLKAVVEIGAILVFKGEVKRQEITVNTGATYSAFLLNAEDSYVKVGSGGKAKVRASRIIEATSNSGGYIAYIGDPVSEFNKTSLGGEIKKYKTDEAAGIEE
jgi:hypothetical protein